MKSVMIYTSNWLLKYGFPASGDKKLDKLSIDEERVPFDTSSTFLRLPSCFFLVSPFVLTISPSFYWLWHICVHHQPSFKGSKVSDLTGGKAALK